MERAVLYLCSKEEDWEERLRILKDSRNLKALAEFFLHPEKPVRVEPNAFGRCYFNRPSAPEQELNAEESTRIMKEVAALKKLAVDYHHPELPVETSATACARCYYDRASAAPQEEPALEEEREYILADLEQLKKAAYDYLHPEVPISNKTTDPTVFGRNYFVRPSAVEQETKENEAERTLVLQDAKVLKKLAMDYRHPELPVSAAHPALFGRNYFARPSAEVAEEFVHEEERNRILSDAMALRQLARDYLHPEIPISATDPTVFARNYFTRPSAVEQTTVDQEEECDKVLHDLQLLKKLAVDYRHPEIPVVASDPTACGRNYFNRPSALEKLEQTTLEDNLERDRVLKECRRLKQLAVDYHHPELPLSTNPMVISRNYFSRPSAVGVNEHIHCIAVPPEVEEECEWSEHDFYYNHHAFFDMEDDVHLHHVAFDKNVDHHHEITELRVAESGLGMDDSYGADRHKLSSSPECVMTFAHPRHTHAAV